MSLTANKSDKIPMKLSQNVESQAFCLRWNSHQSNMLDVFQRLFLDERFVDVTLACEGQLIKAHKMVLSASSSYFQEIFTTTPCPHPVIIMKDVPLKDLRKILEFMYKGEINVSKQEITSLLIVAEVLHVRGLAQIDTNIEEEPQPSTSNAKASTENQKPNKLNRLLKRTSARESSVESLVLIEDEASLRPAKQVKIIMNDSSIKSPQNTLTDELAYNSVHETEDDFLESAAEYNANDDFDPIAIDAVQIKQEEDIISNYSTDNGDEHQDDRYESGSNSDSMQQTGHMKKINHRLPSPMQCIPKAIEKIKSIEDFLRFENAIISNMKFRQNIIKALIERLGDRYTSDDRVSCALMINRLLFVPDFFKLCSWTGRSKEGTQEKFPLQKHKDFLEFFNSIVRQSSSKILSEIELKEFFSSRIRNSFYSPKTDIIPTSRKRIKKHK